MITQEELKRVLEYSPETGLWRWKIRGHGKTRKWFKGALMGLEGYPVIMVNKERYRAASLAWLYVYGEYIKGLDHENRDCRDNRISNLRIATLSQQRINISTQSNNTSGHTGIIYSPRDGRPSSWVARISKDGIRLAKYFRTKEEAITWRKEMEAILFGSFAPIRPEEGDDYQIGP